VHVLGAVAHAGVVTVPGGGRVTDALEAAGGASGDADFARLNLARPLVDGERLYVPRAGEGDVPQALEADGGGAAGAAGSAGAGAGAGAGSGPGASGAAASDVVDLNTADQAALETLPGIGPGLAQRILAWRDEHGRFSAVEDLLDVSGIGDGRFAELQDRVRV
jgi:competence protein ComEA